MERRRRWTVRTLWVWVASLWILGGGALAYDLDAFLGSRDEAVLQYYAGHFPVDGRYQEVLERIAARVNPHLGGLFSTSHEPVRYGVFLSTMGFNGVAWHRLIILDSLLLDTLRRVAEGVAVAGELESPYIDQLAWSVGQLGVQGGFGAPLRAPYVDPENPYSIPAPPGLDHAATQRARPIFEEMLAAWVCHELSHCYLGHCREKIEQELAMQRDLAGRMHPALAHQQIQAFLSFRLSPLKELEADRIGAELAFRAGYGLDGFRRWYRFIDRIEEHTGSAWMSMRTHPPGHERYRAVLEVHARRSLPAGR